MLYRALYQQNTIYSLHFCVFAFCILIRLYETVCAEGPFSVLQKGFHVETGKGLVDVQRRFQFGAEARKIDIHSHRNVYGDGNLTVPHGKFLLELVAQYRSPSLQ